MKLKERIIELKKYNEKKFSNSKVALFLDRDGVIIKDVGYIAKAEDVTLEKGIKNLMQFIYEKKIQVFVITNQSGISRGYFDWKDFDKVNQKMIYLIGEKSPIVAIYANSYLKLSQNNWRKPHPGMILEASKKYNIDTHKSIFVGDRLSDMISGCKSGIKTLIHVKTGHGKKEFQNIIKFCKEDNFICGDKESKILFIDNLLEFPYELYY